MAITTYPGVYIDEVPSGVRTIAGVATSITAFIGRALRGPVNDPRAINNFGDFERIFGGLWLDSAMSFAVRDFYQNGGSRALIVRLENAATAADIALSNLNLVAANPGAWGDELSVTVDHNTRDPADTALFNITISDGAGNREKFLNVSVEPADPRFVALVLDQGSSLVRVEVDGNGDPIVPGTRPNAATVAATAGSGDDGNALTTAQITTGANMQTNKEGLYALERADLFNLLCIPPYLASGDIDASILADVATYCEARRAMLIVDSPTSWTTKDDAVGDGSTTGVAAIGTTSKNAVLYFPRLRKPNPLRENQLEDFAACGAAAGVISRTDAQRGVWKAPAGLEATLVGVPQLSVSLTDPENGELNPLGINCLRSMPAAGRIVWGARTLQGNDRLASEWKYVPVRRLALFIEESLYRGTQWAVFEPNDEPLWSQIRLNLGAFMQNLFRQGAFQGQSPRDAYFVKCDRETTTQNDINLGIVNIHVGFAPLKPAEFVVIKIQQMAGQVEA